MVGPHTVEDVPQGSPDLDRPGLLPVAPTRSSTKSARAAAQRVDRYPGSLRCPRSRAPPHHRSLGGVRRGGQAQDTKGENDDGDHQLGEDRKSTRLNSSHMSISYAVFCLKKKK